MATPTPTTHSLFSPTTCFTVACVAFSFLALSLVVRKQEMGAHKHEASPKTAAKAKAKTAAATVNKAETKEEDPRVIITNVTERLRAVLRQLTAGGDAVNVAQSASLISEVSLTIVTLAGLSEFFPSDLPLVAGSRPDAPALLRGSVSGINATLSLLEAELHGQAQHNVNCEEFSGRLATQRVALDFLVSNFQCATSLPTPPNEKEIDNALKIVIREEAVDQGEQPNSSSPRSSVDSKFWIEPPPEYSPPSHELAPLQEKRQSISIPSVVAPASGPDDSELYDAVSNNNAKLVVKLLQRGADPNTVSEELRRTPVHQAAHLNFCGCLQALLQNGADATMEDAKGDMPLHLAAWEGNVEALEVLLSHGIDVDSLSGRDGYSALWCAIDASQIDAARLLVRYGARVSLRAASGDGRLPLHQAAIMGQSAMCELLLERGAKVDPLDHDSNTPLHYAAASGSVGSVKALLRAGADVRAKQSQGLIALHWAAHKGHSGVVSALLDYGTDINATTNEKATALHLAANVGHKPTVRILVERGADRKRKGSCWDGVFGTPYQIAMANGHGHLKALLKMPK